MHSKAAPAGPTRELNHFFQLEDSSRKIKSVFLKKIITQTIIIYPVCSLRYIINSFTEFSFIVAAYEGNAL